MIVNLPDRTILFLQDREVSSKTSDEPFVTKEEFDQGLVEKAQVSTQAVIVFVN